MLAMHQGRRRSRFPGGLCHLRRVIARVEARVYDRTQLHNASPTL